MTAKKPQSRLARRPQHGPDFLSASGLRGFHGPFRSGGRSAGGSPSPSITTRAASWALRSSISNRRPSRSGRSSAGAIRRAGSPPRHLITDQGKQFSDKGIPTMVPTTRHPPTIRSRGQVRQYRDRRASHPDHQERVHAEAACSIPSPATPAGAVVVRSLVQRATGRTRHWMTRTAERGLLRFASSVPRSTIRTAATVAAWISVRRTASGGAGSARPATRTECELPVAAKAPADRRAATRRIATRVLDRIRPVRRGEICAPRRIGACGDPLRARSARVARLTVALDPSFRAWSSSDLCSSSPFNLAGRFQSTRFLDNTR